MSTVADTPMSRELDLPTAGLLREHGRLLVHASGVAEIASGAGLLVHAAGWR